MIDRRAPAVPEKQFDMFAPIISGDIPVRDSRDTMERPFFSLAKRKRLKAIEYESPDGNLYVTVSANARYGMATIWDADILIYAVSQLVEHKKRGINDVPRTLRVEAYKLLKGIGRGTSGRDYQRLQEALARLQSTTIETNIRAKSKKRTIFSWIDSATDEQRAEDVAGGMVEITISNWMYESILEHDAYLILNPAYFDITGGLERALYRVARKHAGEKPDGQTLRFDTLYDKTGSDEPTRNFAGRLRAIIKRNNLPDYDMRSVEAADGTAAVHFLNRRFVRPDERLIPMAEAQQMVEREAQKRVEDARTAWVDREILGDKSR